MAEKTSTGVNADTDGTPRTKVEPAAAGKTYELKTLDQIQHAIGERWHKIWYDFHRMLAEEVRSGIIRVGATEEYNAQTQELTQISHGTWNASKEGVKRLERKYGAKNLGPLTRYEVGVLDGEIAALRWAIGERDVYDIWKGVGRVQSTCSDSKPVRLHLRGRGA